MLVDRLPFRLIAAIIAVVSFVVLASRSRPFGTFRGLQPILFTSGLTQPRALAFYDGALYVAEAGFSEAGANVVAGRIVTLPGMEQVEVVIADLPAASEQPALFAQGGPTALATAGAAPVPGGRPGRMYVAIGPSPDAPSGALHEVVLEGERPHLRLLGPLGPGLAVSPGAPTGLWGLSGAVDGTLYGTLPLANQLLRLQPAGGSVMVATVTGFIDSGQTNPTPVAAAVAPDGTVLVALFGPVPYRAGTGRIVRVHPDGRWQVAYDSLTFPIALAHAPNGQLFVLEFASGIDVRTGRFLPQSGRLLALGPAPAQRRVMMTEISYPTALTFAPNGDAFLTEFGAFSRPGEGRVLHVPGPSLGQVR